MLSPMNHKIAPCPEVTMSILQNWTNDISQMVLGKVIKGEMCELKDILGHREKNHILFWQIIVLYKYVCALTLHITTIDYYLTSIYQGLIV